MKVAIDTGPLESGHAVRGIGVMVSEWIKALQYSSKTVDKFEVFPVDFRKTNLSKFDIAHYPYFFPYSLTLPSRRTSRKIVVTIQDLIQLLYPDKYPPGFRGKINFIKQKLRLNNVDIVLTISEASKKDIVRFLGIPSEKISVIYLAPKKIYKPVNDRDKRNEIKNKYKLPSKFVLYVGDVNYNKNIPGLLKATSMAGVPLVICGKQALEIENQGVDMRNLLGPRDWLRFIFNVPHPEQAHYKYLLNEFNKNKNVLRLGFVPDEDLVYIFNLAEVYCQPSFYEGFGLPVLEAFACGTPVVVSKTNALTEIAGDAALVADPKDEKDMADKILAFFKDGSLKIRMVRNGFQRVKTFSWEKTAKETIEVYRKVLSNKI